MDKEFNPWQLTNQYGEFRDFTQWLPDHNGIGGNITITLVDAPGEEPGAYGVVTFDTEEGEEVTGPKEFDLTRKQAERILGI